MFSHIRGFVWRQRQALIQPPDFSSFLVPLLPWQWGVLGAGIGVFAPHAPECAAAAAVLLVVVALQRRMVVLGILVGLALTWQTLPQDPLRVDAHDPTWPQEALVRGQVDKVRTYPGGRMVLLVPRPRLVTDHGEEPLPGGLVWTWTDPPQLISPGASFEGRLRLRPIRNQANFGAPQPEARWLRQGMIVRAFSSHDARVSWISQTPNLRQRVLDRLAALCPNSERGMLLALVGGERFWLEPRLVDRVRRAGLAHSLALSGLHVGLVLAGAWFMAHGISRIFPRLLLAIPRPQLAALVGLPLIGGYLWLGGAGPSLVRAALMALVGAWALLRARRLWPQDALFVAAACLLVADPASALEPSTQLSFAAVAAILWTYPVGKKINHHVKFFLPKPVRWLLGLAGVSFAATLATLPLQLFWFGVPSWGIMANVFWLPILSFWVMPWAGIGTLASCIPGGESLAGWALGAAGWGTALLAKALAWADDLGLLREWAVGRMGWQGCLAGAAGILAWTCWCRPRVRRTLLGLALIFASMEWQQWDSSGVRLTVLDTGGSQAVLLETPGSRILVDAGGSFTSDYDVGRQVVVPYLSWRAWPRLDALVASHHDTDHIGGMPAVLRLLAVAEYWDTGLHGCGAAAQALEDAIQTAGIPRRQLRAGQTLDLGDGVRLHVLHPPQDFHGESSNTASLVLHLSWQGQGLALVPGDADRAAWERMRRAGYLPSAQVLVLPHHGSRDALDPNAWQAIAPRHGVAACAPWNRFGHPHAEVRDWLAQHRVALWTTARHGAVRFSWSDPNAQPTVDWARRPHSLVEDIMATILPEDQNLRRAVAWIEEERRDGKSLDQLLAEAGMRFNLSPLEEAKLAHIYAEQQ